MKKIVLFLSALLFVLPLLKAQDTTFVVPDSVYENNNSNVKPKIDTVRIQVGDKKIEIVSKKEEELNDGLDNLKKGLDDFQKKIDTKKQEIEVWSDSIKVISMQMKKAANGDVYEIKIDSLENLIDKNQDIIDALSDGIDDITSSIEDLTDQLDDLHNQKYDDGHSQKYSYNYDEDDTDKHQEHKRKHKKFKGHWASMNLGLNSYVDANRSLNLPAGNDFMTNVPVKSWEFSLNPLQFSIPFFNRYVGAVTGLGLTWNNYELMQNINLTVDANGVLNSQLEPTIEYKKNRFKTINLTLPLLLEIQIPVNKKDERFYLSAGVIGILNLDTKMKYVYYQHNSLMKIKDKATLFPVNRYSYALTARMGFDNTYFYVNYNMLPLFEGGKGPELYPVSAGIGLTF